MKKYILILLMILFFSNLVNAQVQTLKPVEQNDCITLPQSHANATSINITKIRYPDDSENHTIIEMSTENSYDYNYTFCDTSLLGGYEVSTLGNGNGILTKVIYDFEVTPSGELQTTGQSIGSAIVLVLMICLTLICGFIGFKLINFDYLWVLGVLFLVFSVFLVIFDLWLGVVYTQNYIGVTNDTSLIQNLFYLLLFVIVAGILISIVLLAKNYKKVMKWITPDKIDDGWDDNEFN